MAQEKDNIEERDDDFSSGGGSAEELQGITHVSGMYKSWFLDYASYVILERAVPTIEDGLKPVQRRILHSLKEMDDGRYHKVANLIGNTMKYHPHGDASIGDALVQIGQKDLLIDMQGNWGNLYTGDSAAAPRYIEARLTKFALEVVFNAKTTKWLASYDGRSKEPETLPVKFPLLLAQGGEGIAVGLACKMLPHNFNELIDASIAVLKGKKTNILPDFHTAGMADFSMYNNGLRGGRVRVRARIKQEDKHTLNIYEIPFGTNTGSLIESIIKANDKGKIKIRKIEDNTAENVEILIHLPAGVSPDKTIDALYAFTDCEISLSPNACVIKENKPVFMGVNDILAECTHQTLDLLKRELEIRLAELLEDWHFSSLEKIFIEKRIYRDIENCETWEEIISTIHKGLKPYVKKFYRAVSDEDVAKLTEIRIKRISKFDGFKADEHISKVEAEMETVKHHLEHLVEYAIDYFKEIKKKYGEGKDRKTEIRSFDNIQAAVVAAKNEKLYVNKEEGFAGFNMKRGEGEYVCDCSDIDDVVVIREDGKMIVSKIAQKAFFGKGILHCGIWKRGDERTVYNLVYRDGPTGYVMVKRFAVSGVTRDKEYDLTKGTKDSKILYLTCNPNGEAETITVLLRAQAKLRKIKFDFDFSTLAIKGRGAAGNVLSRYAVNKITLKEGGVSTLSAREIWYDESVRRLNDDGRGAFLGDFSADDKILTIMQSGDYHLTGFDLFTQFEDDMICIEKWNPNKPISCIYFDGERETHYVKRFLVEKTDKKVRFISEHEKSLLEKVSTDWIPRIQLNFSKVKDKTREPEVINLTEFIDVKGYKAVGNKLSAYKIKNIEMLEPVPYEEPLVELALSEEDVVDTEDPTLEAEVKHIILKTIPLPSQSKKGTPPGPDDASQGQITFEWDV